MGGKWPRLGEAARLARREIVGLAILLTVTACVTPTFQDGRLAPTERLTELARGASSEDDVRRVLGAPRGYGAIRHASGRSDLRKIWFYEFVRMKDDQVELKILLVFFDQERYDGYMWFGAKELLGLGVS